MAIHFKVCGRFSATLAALCFAFANSNIHMENSNHSNILPIFFPFDRTDDWRTQITNDSILASANKTEKSWRALSVSQDREEVYIYENYFWGMRNGIVLESGALDGLLVSNSFFLEKYANWSAIHIGMIKCQSWIFSFISVFCATRGRQEKFPWFTSKSTWIC